MSRPLAAISVIYNIEAPVVPVNWLEEMIVPVAAKGGPVAATLI
jgi:hypothetical protein